MTSHVLTSFIDQTIDRGQDSKAIFDARPNRGFIRFVEKCLAKDRQPERLPDPPVAEACWVEVAKTWQWTSILINSKEFELKMLSFTPYTKNDVIMGEISSRMTWTTQSPTGDPPGQAVRGPPRGRFVIHVALAEVADISDKTLILWAGSFELRLSEIPPMFIHVDVPTWIRFLNLTNLTYVIIICVFFKLAKCTWYEQDITCHYSKKTSKIIESLPTFCWVLNRANNSSRSEFWLAMASMARVVSKRWATFGARGLSTLRIVAGLWSMLSMCWPRRIE